METLTKNITKSHEMKNLCTYHLLPRGSIPGTPPGNPRGSVQFWYFFFPRGHGELFICGKDFAGSRGHTHGICSRQWDRQGEKALPGSMVNVFFFFFYV